MEIKCEYIDKDSGCLVSFDGSCSKEGCFTYRLMQKLEKIEKKSNNLKKQFKDKEQECKELKEENMLKICPNCGAEYLNPVGWVLFEEQEKYKKVLDKIEQLSKQVFCLTNGTNKDTADLAKQIMRLLAKVKDWDNENRKRNKRKIKYL